MNEQLEFDEDEAPLVRSREALVDAAAADDELKWEDLPIDERTKRMYQREYAAFSTWCTAVGVSAAPATARSVSRYLQHLVSDCGRAIATADRVRAAISVAHDMTYSVARARGMDTPPNPARDILIRATIKRLKKEKLKRGEPIEEPKREISYDELVAMVESEPLTLTGTRNRAIMTVAWFGLFRRSEVAALDLRWLRFRGGRKAGYEVTLLQSKTNKRGELEVVGLSQRDDLPVCPVRELRRWLEVSKISNGPVFRRIYPSKSGGRVGERALSPSVLAAIVKDAGTRVGISAPEELGAHSLRSGPATELSNENVSTDRVMSKGRWRSLSAAQRYIRRGDALGNDPMRTILRDRDVEA